MAHWLIPLARGDAAVPRARRAANNRKDGVVVIRGGVDARLTAARPV